MYEPPAGYDDLLSDAEDAPDLAPLRTLTVPDVGEFQARKPTPRSAAALAMTARGKTDTATQFGWLNSFIQDHLAPGRFEGLLVEMITGDMAPDAPQRVARAVATWGTARPYTAVITLSVLTAHHWRAIRAHLINNGVADPMTGLRSLHALLDVTEAMVLESMAGDNQAENKRSRFYDALYRPDLLEPLNGDGYKPVPAGFEDDAVEASFDAFMATAR